MAVIKLEEIRGVWVGSVDNQNLKCLDCFGNDFSDISSDEILTEHEVEQDDELYFCVLAGCYAVSGEGLVCKISTQYLPEKIFICPLNMMVVDSKGLAALISISKSRQTRVLFH